MDLVNKIPREILLHSEHKVMSGLVEVQPIPMRSAVPVLAPLMEQEQEGHLGHPRQEIHLDLVASLRVEVLLATPLVGADLQLLNQLLGVAQAVVSVAVHHLL